MEFYSYPYSNGLYRNANISSRIVKYNRIQSANRNERKNLNNNKRIGIDSSPSLLKRSLINNNSPISSKTENMNDFRNPRLFHDYSTFIKRSKYRMPSITHKDKLNNSIYTSNSRINKSSNNLFPRSRIESFNNNGINNIYAIDSKIRYYNSNNNNYLNNIFENALP